MKQSQAVIPATSQKIQLGQPEYRAQEFVLSVSRNIRHYGCSSKEYLTVSICATNESQ